jgi:hypothetical protein
LSRYRRPTSAAFAVGLFDRTSVLNSNTINSKGVHVGVVIGNEVFGLKDQLYDLKGSNIYKLNGDLVGHRMHAGLRSVWTKRPTSCSRQPDLPNFQLANSSTALSSSRLKVKK